MGENQRIRNQAEAEALVEVIQSLTADDAYEGKSMGVIALQGHAPAELIERLLVQRLEPKTIEDRRLRWGDRFENGLPTKQLAGDQARQKTQQREDRSRHRGISGSVCSSPQVSAGYLASLERAVQDS